MSLPSPLNWFKPITRFLRRYWTISIIWEVIVVTGLSLIPLLAIGFVSFVQDGSRTDLFAALLEPLGRGQLYLYSFSVLASVIWLVIADLGPTARKVVGPTAVILLIYIILLLGISPEMNNLGNKMIVSYSIYVYTMSVLLYLCSLLIKSARPPLPEETFDVGVDKLQQSVEKLEAQQAGNTNA